MQVCSHNQASCRVNSRRIIEGESQSNVLDHKCSDVCVDTWQLHSVPDAVVITLATNESTYSLCSNLSRRDWSTLIAIVADY